MRLLRLLTVSAVLALVTLGAAHRAPGAVRWTVTQDPADVDCFFWTDATWGKPSFHICMGYGPNWQRLPDASATVTVTPTTTATLAPTATATPTLPPTVTPTPTVTPESGRLTGHVYEDADNDGERDPGEAGVAGVQVIVRASYGIMYLRTCCTTGEYAVSVAPGSYTVSYTLPDGYTGTGTTQRTVTVSAGSTSAADFGIRK